MKHQGTLKQSMAKKREGETNKKAKEKEDSEAHGDLRQITLVTWIERSDSR